MDSNKKKKSILKNVLKSVTGISAAENIGKMAGSIYGKLTNRTPRNVVEKYVWNKISKGKSLASSPENVSLAETKTKELMKVIKERKKSLNKVK